MSANTDQNVDWDNVSKLLGIVDKLRDYPKLQFIHNLAMKELQAINDAEDRKVRDEPAYQPDQKTPIYPKGTETERKV